MDNINLSLSIIIVLLFLTTASREIREYRSQKEITIDWEQVEDDPTTYYNLYCNSFSEPIHIDGPPPVIVRIHKGTVICHLTVVVNNMESDPSNILVIPWSRQ